MTRLDDNRTGWRVLEETGEFDLELVLAHTALEGTDDDYRLVVVWVESEDEPQVWPVYPCQICAWARACGGGVECHS